MASSNRHWPSMFKSKPCNPNHQFQHDINSPLMSTGCHRSPYTSDVAAGCDEKSPEPKPRWNPKPEQIRILEAIFNSGMVNPPRDEIRKIRIQLQEYGEVGDANVFYWFQNRKSRSKHKLRHLHNTKNQNSSQAPQNPAANSLPQFTATSPPSSSSEKSPPEDRMMPPNKGFSIGFSNVSDVLPNSPTASVNQTYFQVHNETNLLIPPPPEAFFPVYHNGQEGAMGSANAITTQGFGFSDLSNVIHQAPHQPYPHAQQNVGPSTNLLLSEIMIHGASSKKYQDQDKAMKIMHQQHPQFISFNQSSTPTTTVVPSITNTTVTVPSPITQFQGVGDAAATPKSTVFINGVAFEVSVGPFNVREAFGDEAVLIQSSGYPVLTDEWGVTLHPLQHGESYYLI